jgi:hypothetical protein
MAELFVNKKNGRPVHAKNTADLFMKKIDRPLQGTKKQFQTIMNKKNGRLLH